jgi:peptidoglycan/xylan/chitin deacetylase (PgdA/CDA1 family)
MNRREFLKFGIGALASLAVPAFMPAIRAQTRVIFHGNQEANYISLTYDDCWDEATTLKIAQAFAEADQRVTFFPAGSAITANNDNPTANHDNLYTRLYEMGHEFGCHLYTHTDITDYDERRLRWYEVEPWLDELERALGFSYTPVAIRPPMGIVTDALFDIAVRYEMPLVLWSTVIPDTYYDEDDGDLVLQSFEDRLLPGEIYLQHTNPVSLAIISRQLDLLEASNLENVLLSELLAGMGVSSAEATPEATPRVTPDASSDSSS